MGLSGACFFLVLPCSLTLILCFFIGFVLIQKDRRQAGRWVGRHLLGSGTPAFPRIPVGFLGEFRRTEARGGWGTLALPFLIPTEVGFVGASRTQPLPCAVLPDPSLVPAGSWLYVLPLSPRLHCGTGPPGACAPSLPAPAEPVVGHIRPRAGRGQDGKRELLLEGEAGHAPQCSEFLPRGICRASTCTWH